MSLIPDNTEVVGTIQNKSGIFAYLDDIIASGTAGVNREFPFTSEITWTVNHGLGVQYPRITCVDENDEEFIPFKIDYVSIYQTIITHTSARSGKAVADTGAANSDLTVSRVDLGTSDVIDWTGTNATFIKDTLTGNITLSDLAGSLPNGTETKVITLYLNPATFSITVPEYWVFMSGIITESVVNEFTIECVNGNDGSELVYYWINPQS